MKLLDFQHGAHASGVVANPSGPFTCIRETDLTSAMFSGRLIAVLIVAFAASASGCVTLPYQHSPVTQTSLNVRRSQSDLRTNINTASPQELEKLPGIGKVIAERIVAHRTQYGPFRRVEHLMMVRGISDRKFRALQSMILLE